MTSEEVEGVESDPWQAGGGPAFPVERVGDVGGGLAQYRGMSLRDYFAGQAVACCGLADPVAAAKRAYAVADAMIAERGK